MRISRGGEEWVWAPIPLKNHKAIKPAFNTGPFSAGQRNRRWADHGPFLLSLLPPFTKEKNRKKSTTTVSMQYKCPQTMWPTFGEQIAQGQSLYIIKIDTPILVTL